MAIESLETIGVADADAVAIAIEGTGCHYHAIEGCHNLIVRTGLEVHARMATLASVS